MCICVMALVRIILKFNTFLMCCDGNRCNRHGSALERFIIKNMIMTKNVKNNF